MYCVYYLSGHCMLNAPLSEEQMALSGNFLLYLSLPNILFGHCIHHSLGHCNAQSQNCLHYLSRYSMTRSWHCLHYSSNSIELFYRCIPHSVYHIAYFMWTLQTLYQYLSEHCVHYLSGHCKTLSDYYMVLPPTNLALQVLFI